MQDTFHQHIETPVRTGMSSLKTTTSLHSLAHLSFLTHTFLNIGSTYVQLDSVSLTVIIFAFHNSMRYSASQHTGKIHFLITYPVLLFLTDVYIQS